MPLQNQYLLFLYAKQLADAGILFKDACAWYSIYDNKDRMCIKIHNAIVNVYNDSISTNYHRENIEEKLNKAVAAPNLEDLIGMLPCYIQYDKTSLKLSIGYISNNKPYNMFKVSYGELDRQCIVIETKDIDPKIACVEMLLLLKEKGLLPELNQE